VPKLEAFAVDFMGGYVRANNGHNEVASKEGVLRRYLLPALGGKRLDEIGPREVERLKADMLAGGLSKKSVNNTLAVLSKLLRWAEEVGDLGGAKVPRFRFYRTNPGFDFLTFSEAERLLEAARGLSEEWLAMTYFALKTGVRYGELCEVRWGDVDLVEGKLTVSRSWCRGVLKDTKTGESRTIPLSPATVAMLKAHRHLRGELVFSKPDGGRHIHRRYDVALKRICRRAGLRPIGAHTLRHTYASHLCMRGVPLRVVQELLGHRSLSMTCRYSHLSPEVRGEAVAVLDLPACNPCATATWGKVPGQEKGQEPRELLA
jgi:integrase